MNISQDQPFEFLLLRPRVFDEQGRLVNEDSDDPEEWALADALSDANVPPKMLIIGRGTLRVISLDERELARMCMLVEPDPAAMFVRVVTAQHPGTRPPCMGDVIALLVDGDHALTFEVMLAWDDIAAGHDEPGAMALVDLQPGEAILHLRADLGMIDIEPEGGADAVH